LDVVITRKSSAWRETFGCPPLNCARWPGKGRRQRAFYNAEWSILTSIGKKSIALNRPYSAICNASAPCANRINDVHGISRVVPHHQHGIGIALTPARWRPLMQCHGAPVASGRETPTGMQFIEEYKLIRPASERIDSLDFCDADACPSCDLEEGEPACLRRKRIFACDWPLGI